MKQTHTSPLTIVHVLGSGHCGSTLLDLILGAHSKVVGVGEVVNVYLHNFENPTHDYRCTCEQNWSACSFWSNVFARMGEKTRKSMAGRRIAHSVFRLLFIQKKKPFAGVKPGQRIQLKTFLDNHHAMYNAIAQVSKKNIIVDSSKDSFRALLLSQDKRFNHVFVHLIRDGRGVFWSYKRKYGWGWRALYLWGGANLKIELVKLKNKRAKVVTVRYEDFVKEPEKIVKRVLRPIGITFEPGMMRFADSQQHQLGGNRMRFTKSNDIRMDEAWRRNLTKKDLRLFTLLAGWLNKIYKY
ncbi:MAG: sulfotransferase [Candidatus Woesearchaeota archaeon]|nr:MAG: sulfotransferase [Candidatus Woesearchaeota archaeon]